MTHAVQNLEIHEGDKQILEVTIADPDGVLGDISGSSLKWELSTSNRSPTALISKTTGSGIVITDGVNRVVEISLDEADSDGILAVGVKWFYHELKIQKTAGQELTCLTGTVEFIRSRVRIA